MSHPVYAFAEERRVKKRNEQVSSQLDRPTGRQMDRQRIDRQIWTAKHMDRDGQADNAHSVPSG